MQFLKKYPLLILFTAFLLITSVVDVLESDRSFSELENEFLQQRPKFSISELLKNKYTPKYENYINDQFIGRDGWITLKSISESALGKIENNGIVYGDKHHMFEYYTKTDEDRIEKNIAFIQKFIDQYGKDVPITFGIIPSAYEMLREDLPTGLPNVNQKACIEQIMQSIKGDYTRWDLYPVLESAVEQAKQPEFADKTNNMNPETYYRTDHHWTTWGAYNAYRSFVQSCGLKAVELSSLKPYLTHVDQFYGTHFSKCKLFSAVPDTIDVYQIPIDSIVIDGEEKPSLHDEEKWGVRDKHAGFLWGNKGVTVLKSQNNLNHQKGKTSRILLIKDSFGNSFAPFLTYSYDEVWVVDPRSLTVKMSDLLAKTEFDDLLIMYNFMNFSSDTNIAKITH